MDTAFTADRLILLGPVLLGVALFNFVPTLIAYATRHPERRRLAALNTLSLVSFLLWAALLVWAVGGRRDDSAIARYVGDARHRRVLAWGAAVLVGLGVATTAYALTAR